MTPQLVAEISSNHNCWIERALRIIDAAAESGFDAVKFQQFRLRELFSIEALRNDSDLLKREAWELPESFNPQLAERAHGLGLSFGSTPFYSEAVELLEPLVDFFKISSYQILWHGILREVGRTEKPVVLSTGMATLDEIERAVEVLDDAGCRRITLLHCVSNYPMRPEDANLAAIDTLRDEFALPCGWSDHSVDARVVKRAVQHYRAKMVELHFDMDGHGEEFDGGHCWLPEAVRQLREDLDEDRPFEPILDADGDGVKAPRPSEAHEREWRSDPTDGLRPRLAVRRGMRQRGVA